MATETICFDSETICFDSETICFKSETICFNSETSRGRVKLLVTNSMTVIPCEYKLVLVSFEEVAGDDGSIVNLHMIGVASSSTKCNKGEFKANKLTFLFPSQTLQKSWLHMPKVKSDCKNKKNLRVSTIKRYKGQTSVY